MTPDLLDEKKTVLNETVGMRLITVDFLEIEGKKVVFMFVVDVTATVEISGEEEANDALLSVILLNLEV